MFSKFIVIFVILSNVAFTVAVLSIFYKTGFEPSTLIVAWFGFTATELIALSKITRKKIDHVHSTEFKITKSGKEGY